MKIIFTGKSFGVNLVNESSDYGVGAVGNDMDNTDLTEEGAVKRDVESIVTAAPSATGSEGTSAVKEKADDNISSSRKRALEATQEEFDEYGLSKSSLQHAIVNTFQHMYPRGYDMPPGANGVDEQGEDGDDVHIDRHESRDFTLDSARGMLDAVDALEDDVWGLADDENLPVTELKGGILIVSASAAADSAVKTYAFSDSSFLEPPFCMEVSIGTGHCEAGKVCRERPFSDPNVESVISLGKCNIFRSTVVPLSDSLCDCERASLENQLQSDVAAYTPRPLAASIIARPDGAVRVQLREYGTGKTVFQMLVKKYQFVP